MKNYLYLALFLSVGFLTQNVFAQSTLVVTSDPADQSYVETTINDDGTLQGIFPGWCANANISITTGRVYNFTFYSSLLPSYPEGLIDMPEHLDSVNWLINQDLVGTSSPGGFGQYTYGDEQVAMWTLLNFTFETDETVEPFSYSRVNELVVSALTKGNGFRPTCNQIVGMILDTRDAQGNKAQTLIVEIPRRHFPKCVVPRTSSGEIK